MNYSLLVTGPPFGSQNATSALLFSYALLKEGHKLSSIFFYREGVLNANLFIIIPKNEFNLLKAWQDLNKKEGVLLKICISSAFYRGILNAQEAEHRYCFLGNLQLGFNFSSLRSLAADIVKSDRVVQF
ncbi:sulfurtransferase complex subunit TusD [Candidatus Pantoea edessiphila]|uniref:Sulfurtransferase complex subunit TusD n=1 Tax=Candidatus Pantoea edessiphila TaxID=2044610 RepID=A0A2P5SXV1_9GAMM|nr:sulfurtransferase complex subunit TusD [Candidatus Pantoea edessiphila]MBK4775770.1 sulfurtransferase complex subunit TusD [Pantoea sp. Edef]PPI87166.1 sulfurtransferase complex subunit TusD [Candidatus Pantoea edessiphila]